MSTKQVLFGPGSEGGLRDLGLLVLRIGFAGSLLVLHGLGKLDRVLDGSSQFPDPLGIGSGLSLGLATFAEFLCSIAVIIGLTTRLATIPLIATFGVALFVYHAGDPLGDRELALLYFVGFVAVLCSGPGRFSVDEVLSKRR